MIDLWRTEHPNARAVSQVRFADFAAIVSRSGSEKQGSGSLFGLIGLDPLGNLDPAVREIEQTRQLAERAIYYLQRAPNLLDMQVERLVYQLAVMPETRQTLASVDRVSVAAESLGELSADAPAILARERHAIITELTATLHAEQSRMQELLVELHDVLKAGAQTSDSVGATVVALDAFVARFQPQQRRPPPQASRALSLRHHRLYADGTRAGRRRAKHASAARTAGFIERGRRAPGEHIGTGPARGRRPRFLARHRPDRGAGVAAFSLAALAYRYASAVLHVRRTPAAGGVL